MSDGAVVNLAARRAMLESDCRMWTPLDALKDAVRQIENGELKPDMVYIAMRELTDDGMGADWPSIVAGGTAIEINGLLVKHMHRQLSDD